MLTLLTPSLIHLLNADESRDSICTLCIARNWNWVALNLLTFVNGQSFYCASRHCRRDGSGNDPAQSSDCRANEGGADAYVVD